MGRARWQQHAGEYRAASGGTWISVLAVSGGLYLRPKLHWNREGLRLAEFGPGVFVTPDGRAVTFRDDAMEFGGLSFTKA